jgi:hypothetical protein
MFVQTKARHGLACEYLFQRKLSEARTEAEKAREFDYPRNNHDVSAILGVICLHEEDTSTAARVFCEAVSQADSILALTPRFYRAVYAKALALAGLSVCDWEGGACENAKFAKITYLKAGKICSAAGVVARAAKLFSTLAKMDHGGILQGARAALKVDLFGSP